MQCVSDPILCTQPLGSPEIYKMSLRESDAKGGVELFIIGKNFHKDSKVIFECLGTHWRKVVVPQKEFLNSTHLVCQVPSYDGLSGQCLPLVHVDVSVHCNHKNSDPMKFMYTNGFGGSGTGGGGIGNNGGNNGGNLVSSSNGKARKLCLRTNQITLPLFLLEGFLGCTPSSNGNGGNGGGSMNSNQFSMSMANGFSDALVGSMNSSQAANLAAAAAYATVVANPITSASNANALFLLERNDILK